MDVAGIFPVSVGLLYITLMPLIGFHQSIAGGYHNALLAAHALGCATVQLFTVPPGRWPVPALPEDGATARSGKVLPTSGNPCAARALTAEDIRTFRRTLRQTRLRLPMGHNCYLINLASPEPGLYRRSMDAMLLEYQRAEALGLRYLVMHPGSPVDGDEAAGVVRVARALDEIHGRCPGYRCQILLETTAGQGNCLGHRFEHLASILASVAEPKRLGVCLDTCHIFAAGYALAPEPEYRATMRAFDKIVGTRWLRAFHLNDSKKPLGSRVDRHAHIGKGCLGLEPFRLLLNDPRFRNRPMVLETPKEGDNDEEMDPVNLGVLRELATDEHGKTRIKKN
jgi:deoxyribonuclease IV